MCAYWGFNYCRERIAQAKKRRKEMVKLWTDYLSNDPYLTSLDITPSGEGTIYVDPQYDTPPTQFSLLLGELLYQLRSALDGSIYAYAVRESGLNPPPKPYSLEFPVRDSKSEFNKARKKMEPLSSSAQQFIESLQPYNLPDISNEFLPQNFNRTLGILNDWARIDRHRKLHVLRTWALRDTPTIHYPSGCTVEYLNRVPNGILEEESLVARFKIGGYEPEMKVEVTPNVALDLVVDEEPRPCCDGDTLTVRLQSMILLTGIVVDNLEELAGKC